jgi:hypothetical protein
MEAYFAPGSVDNGEQANECALVTGFTAKKALDLTFTALKISDTSRIENIMAYIEKRAKDGYITAIVSFSGDRKRACDFRNLLKNHLVKLDYTVDDIFYHFEPEPLLISWGPANNKCCIL